MSKNESHGQRQINLKLQGQNVSSFLNISKRIESALNSEENIDRATNIQQQNKFETSLQDKPSLSQPILHPLCSNEYDQNRIDQYKRGLLEPDQSSTNHIQSSINDMQIEGSPQNFLEASTMQHPKLINSPSHSYNRKIIISAKPSEHETKLNGSKTQQLSGQAISVRKQNMEMIEKVQNSLFLFTLIRQQIIGFIESFTTFGRNKNFSIGVRRLIEDKADYYEQKNHLNYYYLRRMQKMVTKAIQCFVKIFLFALNKLPLFNPENKIRILINSIIVCYNCFYLMIVSLNIFFQADFGEIQEILNYIAIVAWVTEMLMQMNTATYYEGDFITNRKTILKIYIKEYFFFEILPLLFEGKQSANTVVNILFHFPLLLKLKGMSIILSKLEFLVLQLLNKRYILQIFKVLLQLLLLIHLMACSYMTLAKFEQNILLLKGSWLDTSLIISNEDDWWSAYVEAQLWAFHTMGNSYSISVHTQYEYAFTSFWMLISSVLYAYLINTLGNILSDINLNSENYRRDVNVLNRYMKRKKIELELQRVMNTHLVKQYEQESQIQYELENETLSKLSPHMRIKLVTESNKNILSQLKIFKMFSQQTLTNVYQIMQEESFADGQMIQTFDQNSLDSFVYLILAGSGILSSFHSIKIYYLRVFQIKLVEIVQTIQINEEINDEFLLFNRRSSTDKQWEEETNSDGKKVVKVLKIGDTFGEYEFFANTQLNYSIQSLRTTTVMKISRKKFLQIINQNKQDYQKFMEIKQRITLLNEICAINSCCIFCQMKNHHFLDCTQTHLSKKPLFLLSKYTHSQDQERNKKFSRRYLRHQKCIINILTQDDISTLYQMASIQEQIQEDDVYLHHLTNSKPRNNNMQIREEVIEEPESSQTSCFDTYQEPTNIQTNQSNQNITSMLKINSIGGNQSNLGINLNGSNLNNNGFTKQYSNLKKSIHNKMSQMQDNIHNSDKKEQSERHSFSLVEDKERVQKGSLNLNNFAENIMANQIYYIPQSSLNSLNIPMKRKSLQTSQNVIVIPEYRQSDTIQTYEDILQKHSLTNFTTQNSALIPQTKFQQPQILQQGFQNFYNADGDRALMIAKWDHSNLYWLTDKKYEFPYFFPHNNCEIVITQCEEKRERFKRSKKRKTRISIFQSKRMK